VRQPRFFQENSYYHIVNWGNNQNVFLHQRDYRKFLFGLEKYSKKFSISVLVYALMPDHIHLLVKQKPREAISKFMQSLMTSHVTYFNNKHRRYGHLFQGRFKHVVVDTDEYLVHLSRYIHLNPSSSSIVRKPEDYLWSSYRAYLGLEGVGFVTKRVILSYFSSKDPVGDYKQFVESRIDYQKEISLQKLFLEYP
jgi:REP element-mobilizing transposase RayT